MNEYTPAESHKDSVLKFRDRVLPALPDSFVEPGSRNRTLTPWGMMPADPYMDKQVRKQQMEADAAILEIYETPPTEMPNDFVEMVVDDHIINAQRRAMTNYKGFSEWSAQNPPELDESRRDILYRRIRRISLAAIGGRVTPQSFGDKIDLYRRGQSTILESAEVLMNTDIRRGEAGEVAHPYGYRMQYVANLREETSEAIGALGGVDYPDILPYRNITVAPHVTLQNGAPRLSGLRVKYKHDFGSIPLSTPNNELRFTERQIAGYRVDEDSGFDQSLIENFYADAFKGVNPVQWNNPGDKRIAHRMKKYGIQEYVEAAVQADSLENFVVPLSTKMYMHKAPTNPVSALGRSTRNLENYGDMAFFTKN